LQLLAGSTTDVLTQGKDLIEQEYYLKLSDFTRPLTFRGNMEVISMPGESRIERHSLIDQEVQTTYSLKNVSED
jgi:hypothetical protein